MATAAFDPTAGGDTTGPLAPPSAETDVLRIADGPPAWDEPDPTPGRPGGPVPARWDAAAALVRILAIVLGVTAAGWALVRRWPDEGGSRPGAYGSWLIDWLPVRPELADSAAVTAQVTVAALAVAAIGGLLVAVVARWRRLTGAVTGAGLMLAALAGPPLAITARYWLLERRGLGTGSGAGAVGVSSSWKRAVDDLLLPAAAAGLPAAPALAALFTPPRAGERRWWTGLAAPLADRGGPIGPAPGWGPARPVGLPVAVLVSGVAASEIVFRRPGLFARLAERSTLTVDPVAVLDVVTALAVGAAALALIVDLIALALAPVVARRRARHPEPRAGTETLFAAASGPALPSPRAVRVAAVVVAGLVAGGLMGATVAPRPGPSGVRTFGPPLLDGVLGSDGAARDLLALTASGLGRAVIATAGPAFLAALLALALAPVARRLPRAGRLVPGALIDALWAPAGVLAIVAVPAIGRQATLLDPLVLALTGLALVPAGLRLAVRTTLPARAGRLLQALALWLLLAPPALAAHVTAGFLGPDAGGPTLGRLLAESLADLGRSPWPALWPALAAGLLAVACTDLGSSLASLARQQAGRRPDGGDDEPWAISRNAVHDAHPWFDGEATEPENEPVPVPAAAEPADHEEDDDDEDTHEDEDDDEPAERAGLTPNFSLQPGLPPPELHETMRLPVVRIRLAAADGTEPPAGVEEPN